MTPLADRIFGYSIVYVSANAFKHYGTFSELVTGAPVVTLIFKDFFPNR